MKYIITFCLICLVQQAIGQETKEHFSIKDMIKTDAKSLSQKGELKKQKTIAKTSNRIKTDKKSLSYTGEINISKKRNKNSAIGKLEQK